MWLWKYIAFLLSSRVSIYWKRLFRWQLKNRTTHLLQERCAPCILRDQVVFNCWGSMPHLRAGCNWRLLTSNGVIHTRRHWYDKRTDASSTTTTIQCITKMSWAKGAYTLVIMLFKGTWTGNLVLWRSAYIHAGLCLVLAGIMGITWRYKVRACASHVYVHGFCLIYLHRGDRSWYLKEFLFQIMLKNPFFLDMFLYNNEITEI